VVDKEGSRNTALSDGSGGRDNKGRFAPGNTVGTASRKKLAVYRDAIYAAETPEDAVAVVRAMKDKALDDGCHNAAKLYLSYTVGQPRKIEDEHDGEDGFSVAAIDRYFQVERMLSELAELRNRLN